MLDRLNFSSLKQVRFEHMTFNTVKNSGKRLKPYKKQTVNVCKNSKMFSPHCIMGNSKTTRANSVDPKKAAHYEAPQLELPLICHLIIN